MTIRIEPAHFDDVSADEVTGAGIMPVVCDDDGTFFLLGKERYIPHWRGSLKWSAFEGGRKAHETVERAAAREFVEESLATVPLQEGVEPTVDSVERYLQSELYVSKITICITNDALPQRSKTYHVTFVVQLDHCVSTARFDNVRRILVDLASPQTADDSTELARRLPHLQLFLDEALSPIDDFMEKTEMRWWTEDDLKLIIANGGCRDGDSFRAYFLPVLQTALRVVDDAKEQSRFATES